MLINPLLSGNGFDEFSERSGKDVPPQIGCGVEERLTYTG